MIETIIDVETGQVLEKPLNDEVIREAELYRAKVEQELAEITAEATAKEAARQALLDKLGITADEAKLLLS